MRYYDKNDAYFTKNFSRFVDKYGGKWVVIAGGKLIGVCPKAQLKKFFDLARKKFPKDTPLVSPIPREEEIQCILWHSLTS